MGFYPYPIHPKTYFVSESAFELQDENRKLKLIMCLFF